MWGAISGHHGSPTTWFLPFECMPCGIGHRAVVGITPSWASRRRPPSAPCESLDDARDDAQWLRAHVGMCAQYRMLYFTTLRWHELDRLGWTMIGTITKMYLVIWWLLWWSLEAMSDVPAMSSSSLQSNTHVA